MVHVITPLSEFLCQFRGCFSRSESFTVFQHVIVSWILCLRGRTLSEVWQLTGLGKAMHFDAIYSLFSNAVWDWDELGVLLCAKALTSFLPSGLVSIVVDDTLCHKRGKYVSFGGIFLDPVLSTKSHKILRFGVNYVVVALVVRLPFRPDRYFALPVLWRVFRKKGQKEHRKRTELAGDMVRHLAAAFPERSFCLVADGAYVNSTVLAGLPGNVAVIGPLTMKAALHLPPLPKAEWQKGRPRKRGLRLPTPAVMLKDPERLPEMAKAHAAEFALVADLNAGGWSARVEEVALPKVFKNRASGAAQSVASKALRVQVLRGVLWYGACKERPVTVALVHDPEGKWRDEVLLSTRVDVTAAEMIQEYGKRWSVELAFHDSKQYLGLEDPEVRTAGSVGKAHPTAWFCQSLVLLWYGQNHEGVEEVERHRPWYTTKAGVTFTDMLGAARLHLWKERLFAGGGRGEVDREMVEMLVNEMALV